MFKQRFIIVLLMCLMWGVAVSQDPGLLKLKANPNSSAAKCVPQKPVVQKTTKTRKTSSMPKDTTKITYIFLEHAMRMEYDENVLQDAQLLVDDVCFRHDEAYLYCDSAYFFQIDNSFQAFGNVRIEQGDTLQVFGNRLTYDGNTKMAKLRGDVRMINRDVELVTDSLNYDRQNNVGYYFHGGKLHNNQDTLTSRYGYYYPDTKTAFFKTDVVGTNVEIKLFSDTLKYNTQTKLATILGPTYIYYQDSATIYSERGWYNTDTEQSMLLDNSYVQTESGKTLIGDTIFYDSKFGKGEGFGHVELRDTVKLYSVFGNYGYYIENNEEGLVTDSALFVEYSTNDTLYLHADTVYTHREKLSIVEVDSITSLSSDSVYNVVYAYPNVRLYRSDIQGIADSAYYNTCDSVLKLTKDPVVWAEGKQLTGDTIRVYSDTVMDYVRIIGKAFMCEKVDSTKFNQLSGKEILGYIKTEELRKVDVLGNAQSIFYPEDDNGELMGLNCIESSYLYAYIVNQELDRLVFMPSPSGYMMPLDMVTPEMMFLANYSWRYELKPIDENDLYRSNKPQKIVTKQDGVEELEREEENGEPKKKTTRKPQKDKELLEQEEEERNAKRTTTNDEKRPSGFGFGSSDSFGNSNGFGQGGFGGNTLGGIGGGTTTLRPNVNK